MKLDKCDILFSKYIRKRDNWRCQRCGSQYRQGDQGLHCSHYFGRTRESTRYDPMNCDALCFSCHKHFDEANPEEHREWKIKRIGQEEFDRLRMRADSFQKKDRKLSYLIIKNLYESL